MPNLKDIKTRIGSVKKTRQITAAMKLVAGAKLRKATERALSARPYQQHLSDVLGRVAASAGEQYSDPLLERRDEVKSILVVILTSDKGLCGPFNSILLRHAVHWLQEWRDEDGVEIHLKVYGRKGVDFLTHRDWKNDKVLQYQQTPRMDLVRTLCTEMTSGFAEGRFDEVWLVYNQFVNTMIQRPQIARAVPLALPESEDAGFIDHRYEPSAEGLLGRLLPLYLRTVVLQAFLETEAGEHAARMTAMDNATRNASDLIDTLTLDYNRARQAAITSEIIEIVSGAEAL
ncbi:MAG: ATP synthase F1 subunit gamma [Deltaproteobacteria bacterium]|nr:ATP synthase F1 subunit gamma [Deltaproteobacteria bacterium]